MLPRLINILGILVILTAVLPIQASTDAIETARTRCNNVESPLDVQTGCEIQINCLFNSATINCTDYTLINLINSCIDLPLRQCVDIATLTQIAIVDAVMNFQSFDTTLHLNNSLRAFLEKDYQTAIDLYENVTLSLDYFPHHALELGLGILYLRFDNLDVALIQFDKSLNLEFYNPITFYYRGNTYEQRGNTVRALRDHYLYDLLADTQVKSYLPLRSFRIQIPNSYPWIRYPIYTLEKNLDVLHLQDDTLSSADDIVVSFVDDEETLVIAEWLDIVADDDKEILFFERDPENPLQYLLNINQQDIPNSVISSKIEISVVVSPTHLDLYQKSTLGNNTTLITSLANRPPETDVRSLHPKRLCTDSGLSFLEIGSEVKLLSTDYTPQVHDTLNRSDVPQSLDPEDDRLAKPLTILDGGLCIDGAIWWYVSNGTITGWIQEHTPYNSTIYNLLPLELSDLWFDTPPTPLQYLGR